MTYFVGLDVSVESTPICVIDGAGGVEKEFSARSHPENLVIALAPFAGELGGNGLEAGPLSSFLAEDLSDNGASYIAGDLADYLDEKGMDHVRGAPYHPQTQGKIERWHQTMKNRVLLEHYFLPGDLERQIGAFVEY